MTVGRSVRASRCATIADVDWEDAWQEALYGAAGLYRRAAPAEHFATSAQGLPGSEGVLAAAVVELARRHACTRVVDVGAGGGELLGAVAALDPTLELTGVDVVEHAPAPGVRWVRSPGGAALPATLRELEATLVLAHEWLDVVPCPVVTRDGDDWRRVRVDRHGAESLGEPLDGPELEWVRRWVPEQATRAEVGLPRDRAAGDLLGRLRSGVLVLVDYGHQRATRPVDGSLVGYRSGRVVPPVPDGSCDLTAHVAVDSLVEHLQSLAGRGAARVTTQREALADLLPDAAGPVPHDLARTDPTAYLRALARRSALGVLGAPGGLGDFTWIVLPRTPAPGQ